MDVGNYRATTGGSLKWENRIRFLTYFKVLLKFMIPFCLKFFSSEINLLQKMFKLLIDRILVATLLA